MIQVTPLSQKYRSAPLTEGSSWNDSPSRMMHGALPIGGRPRHIQSRAQRRTIQVFPWPNRQTDHFPGNKRGMASDFWRSTQSRYWKFTRAGLTELRDELVSLDVGGGSEPLTAWNPHCHLYLFNLVQSLGQRLNTRQRVLATAHVYLSRMYTRIALFEINPFLMAATAVYVASKAEELPQHIRTISNEARILWDECMPPEATQIAECEFYLLDELRSCLVVFHPYRSLMELCKSMEATNPMLVMSAEELQGAWSSINDSYASDIPLLHAPHIVALAALYQTMVLRPQLARPQRPPDKIKARVNMFAAYMGRSSIDLEAVAECMQEFVSLYAAWDTYDQRTMHQKIQRALGFGG